jgi:hypothetical protein
MKQLAKILAGAVIAVLAVAVIARLLIGPDLERPGANEPQQQQVACDGAKRGPGTNPTHYHTVAEAEVGFGFHIPEIHAPGWSLVEASDIAYRISGPNFDLSPPPPPQPREFVGANLTYLCVDRTELTLLIRPLSQPFVFGRDTTTNRVPAPIPNRDAEMVSLPDGILIVFWQEDDREYAAYTLIRGGFSEADFLAVIGSMQ